MADGNAGTRWTRSHFKVDASLPCGSLVMQNSFRFSSGINDSHSILIYINMQILCGGWLKRERFLISVDISTIVMLARWF